MIQVGPKLRSIRKAKHVTLVELAKRSGIDQATLSRIENGKMTGTLESHITLCESLGITLSELYKDISDAPKSSEHQSALIHEIDVAKGENSAIKPLTKNALQKNMMAYLLLIEPRGKHHEKKNPEKIEKFVYVLDGAVEMNVEGEKYTLKKGESLYCNASLSHEIKNLKTTTAKCLCVLSPPAI